MAIKIPLYVFSHHRKIAYLYKKYLRLVEGCYRLREHYVYQAAIVRADFDLIYNEKDMRKSKQMMLEKEKEIAEFVLPPIIFPSAPQGTAYERKREYDDSCLDYWHPYEKAAYPEYFARREIRKQQYLELWEKMHGPPKPDDYSDH